MRRKAGNLNPLSPAALSDSSDGPKSPASTGAMDDLLQKLRAAKPEARDQRDRRRRARLKDRHQVRVASGQKIPELGVNIADEEGEGGDDNAAGKSMLSPRSEAGESEAGAVTSPVDPAGGDVADRAAAMLEGLQGGSSLNKDGSLSVRRRRENAGDERERRRRRRQQATSTASSARSEDGGLMSPTDTILEEDERRGSVVSGDGTESTGVTTPVTIVSPPSPDQSRKEERELPTPPPES